ncbi:MAG: triphosphoribosyl-dephospho-CoA synthase [Balneolaceae bacterium]
MAVQTTHKDAVKRSLFIGRKAACALVEEARLTPKPGLVDEQNSGSHSDMSCGLMIKSAEALKKTFVDMAKAAYRQNPSQTLREELACIGRSGEKTMFETTGHVNTHMGAIWTLGLLTAGVAILWPEKDVQKIVQTAGRLAGYPDRYAPVKKTNGYYVSKRYGTRGARGEAEEGYPHIMQIALPHLVRARQKGLPESLARIDTLVALMATLDDTCILHRGGPEALYTIKEKAQNVIRNGGTGTMRGWQALADLDKECLERHVSPGGSADLLAATIFLDSHRNPP